MMPPLLASSPPAPVLPPLPLLPPPALPQGIVDVDLMRAALQRLRAALPRLRGAPENEAVLIEALPGSRLRLSANRPELRIAIELPAQLAGVGSGQVSLRQLEAVLKGGRAHLLEFGSEGTELSFALAGSRHTLRSLDAEPARPLETLDGAELRLPAQTFATALREVMPALSRERHGGCLRELRLEAGPEGLRLVASDGFRIALSQIALESPPGALETLLPPQLLAALTRGPAMPDAPLSLRVGEGQVGFDFGPALRLCAPRTVAEYPNYRPLLEHAPLLEVQFDAATLHRALQDTAGLWKEALHERVWLSVGGSTLTLSVQGDAGSCETGFECRQRGSAAHIKLPLHAPFLRDALACLTGEATLSISGRRSPLTLRSAEPGRFTAVLLPQKD